MLPFKTRNLEAIFAICLILVGVLIANTFRPDAFITEPDRLQLTVMCDSVYLTNGGDARISVRHKSNLILHLKSQTRFTVVSNLNSTCKKEVIQIECIPHSLFFFDKEYQVLRIQKNGTVIWPAY